ncbi:AraC family transcriptional regulator [Echinicola marina]|uniref:AraC family transcriptional regulator n=1 Tax=Echinicola marina TaxID=2859768 RepID=UPI001CF6C76F|nr:AraC family transcriptional regulator [Echinicola marina]UCS91754.1 AraC family transcriptional regulator [Echinicola marina]
MKISIEKINTLAHQSFFVKEVNKPYFTAPLHFHPEFEILFILEGYGSRYVGDCIEAFGPEDLVLLGPNIPHLWQCDQEFYHGDLQLRSRAICIQFNLDFLGADFLVIPEMAKIQQLLQQANRGIRFIGGGQKVLKERILELVDMEGMGRVTALLMLLESMASAERIYLSSPDYSPEMHHEKDSDKMDLVFNYVMKHFKEKITLAGVSSLVHMSPEYFCKYFKVKTNKNFSEFLNEVRIGHACKLLMKSDLNISEICYESGFNHLSNFNRQFKKIKKMPPRDYQKQFWKLNERGFS